LYKVDVASDSWRFALAPLFEALRGNQTLQVFCGANGFIDDSDDRHLHFSARSFSIFVKSCRNLRWLELTRTMSRAVTMVHVINAITHAPHLEKIDLTMNFEGFPAESYEEMVYISDIHNFFARSAFDESKPYPVIALLPHAIGQVLYECKNLVECAIFPDAQVLHHLGEEDSCGHVIFEELSNLMSLAFNASLADGHVLCHVIPQHDGGTLAGLRALLQEVEASVAWKPERHRHFPATFRRNVRVFLLCLSRCQPVLPVELVYKIVGMVAWSYPIPNSIVDFHNQSSPPEEPELTFFEYLKAQGCNVAEVRAEVEHFNKKQEEMDAERLNYRHERSAQEHAADRKYSPSHPIERVFEETMMRFLENECIEEFSSLCTITSPLDISKSMRVGMHVKQKELVYENHRREAVLKFVVAIGPVVVLRSFVKKPRILQHVRMFLCHENELRQIPAYAVRAAQTQNGALEDEKNTEYL
jgi:hypothetical protein